MEKGNFATKPDGIERLRILVHSNTCIRKQLADFITRLPKANVVVWVTTGWNNAIPSGWREHAIIDKYFDELKTEGSPIVQSALKSVRRKEVIGNIIS